MPASRHLSRRTVLGATAAALSLSLGPGARAASPTRILVPFPAGGGADFLARVLADKLKDELGRNILIENRPGAGTRLAAETLKQAAPDGKTVLLSPTDPMVILPMTMSKLRYDPATDFTPITEVAGLQFALVVSAASRYRRLDDFVQAARADRDQAMLGISALGTGVHFLAFDFARQSKADISIVPYQGGPALVNNLVGGQLPAAMDGATVFVDHHRAGKLRVLATSGEQRSQQLPDVPTFAELRYPTLVSTATYGLYAPAGTPPAEIDAWNRATRKTLAMADVRARLEKVGYEVSRGNSPAEVLAGQQQSAQRWAPVIKASGFRGD